MKVPLLDLTAQYATIKPELDTAISEVMQSQHFILGPKVRECEEAIAKYSTSPFAIGVSSGTDALLVCLMNENIGPGDEVITPPYSFFATAGCVARTGATPVFVDVEPATYNINPALIEAKITPRTKAIIPVHLYGQMADMDAILEIARRHRLVVIEDAAQAIGAEHNGKQAGSLGEYGCFSFFPSKNLGGAGDGGMVVTGDASRAEKLKRLRAHGAQPKYYHQLIGGNFRLDALQAAIVSVKLKHLDAWTSARQQNAQRYKTKFVQAGLVVAETSEVASSSRNGSVDIYLPSTVNGRHIYNQYIIRVAHRDKLKAALDAKEVGTEVYYPVPLHLQECFAYLGHKEGDFPESERAARETLALPIYPELSNEQASYVVECVRDFFKG
jgi:dTDP-4-amino-4,6-dideoxygalactose transaminase